MIKEILNTAEKVEQLLIHQPELRDNDNRLIAVFWAYEIGIGRLDKISASDLLGKISRGVLTAGDVITRARRKLQEHDEGLRGKNYGKRKKMAKEVRNGIN